MPKLGNVDTKPKNKIEDLSNIKTPEELYTFMASNLSYGFVDWDGKIYSPQHEGWRQGEQPEQKLQDPKELLESGYGTCWEQTELERTWFSEHDFEFKTFLLMFDKDNIGQANPAHTFLAYKKDDRWYWFENTLDKHNGTLGFDSLEDLLVHVKAIIIKNALDSHATEEDIKKCQLYEYETPAYGISPEEFISKVLEEGKRDFDE